MIQMLIFKEAVGKRSSSQMPPAALDLEVASFLSKNGQ